MRIDLPGAEKIAEELLGHLRKKDRKATLEHAREGTAMALGYPGGWQELKRRCDAGDPVNSKLDMVGLRKAFSKSMREISEREQRAEIQRKIAARKADKLEKSAQDAAE